MKIFYKLLFNVIIFSTAFSAYSQFKYFDSQEFFKINSNFIGSIYNNNSLFIFGDDGYYLSSDDMGINWNQQKIDNSLDITSVTINKFTIYALNQTKILFYSTSNGQIWNKMLINSTDKLLKIVAYNNELFILSESKIFRLNSKNEILKVYSINLDTNTNEMLVFNNHIYYSKGNGVIGYINLGNDYNDSINLNTNGICQICPKIENMKNNDNFGYFQLNEEFFEINLYTVNKITNMHTNATYALFDGDIYELYNKTDSQNMIDSLYFSKFNQSDNSFIAIKKPGNDRYIYKLKFNNIQFINKSTIIGYGKNKLIYLSKDSGLNWELISHLYSINPVSFYKIDTKNYLTIIPENASFIKSTNSGITWLPQKNFENNFIRKMQFDFTNSGTSNYIDNDHSYIFKVRELTNDSNFICTNNNFDSLIIRNNDDLKYLAMSKLFSARTKSGNYIFLPGQFQKNRYTILFNLGSDLKIKNKIVLDSCQVVGIEKDKSDNLLAVALIHKGYDKTNIVNQFTDQHFGILKSIDGGSNWDSLCSFTTSDSKILPYIVKLLDNDLFIYFTNGEIYKYNLIDNSIIKILTKFGYQFSSISKIDNKIFLSSYKYEANNKIKSYLFRLDDFLNTTSSLTDITPSNRFSRLNAYNLDDSLILFQQYDSLRMNVNYYLSSPTTPLGVEADVEILKLLFLSQPYPNPASDFVKVKLYYDKSKNVNFENIKLFDFMGNKIDLNSKIDIHYLNDYTKEITLNCKDLVFGIYFLSVNIDNGSSSIPFIRN